MDKYRKQIICFLKDFTFIVPVIIVTILGYGYLLAHSTVNVDSLSADRYFEGLELIRSIKTCRPINRKNI